MLKRQGTKVAYEIFWERVEKGRWWERKRSISLSLSRSRRRWWSRQSVSQGKQKILSKREPAEQPANDGRRSAHLAGNVSWAPLPRPKITPQFLFRSPHLDPTPAWNIDQLVSCTENILVKKKQDSLHTSTGAETDVRAGMVLHLAVVVAVSLRKNNIIERKKQANQAKKREKTVGGFKHIAGCSFWWYQWNMSSLTRISLEILHFLPPFRDTKTKWWPEMLSGFTFNCKSEERNKKAPAPCYIRRLFRSYFHGSRQTVESIKAAFVEAARGLERKRLQSVWSENRPAQVRWDRRNLDRPGKTAGGARAGFGKNKTARC